MKRWYVVQVYAGYEEQIKSDIIKRIEELGISDLFGQILIPSAKAKRFFEISTESVDQQLFPGYLVIEIEPVQEAFRVVATRPRVIRFLGGKEPVALSEKEVDRIQAQIRGEVIIPVKKHEFEMGKEVEIGEGPFAGFFGIIEKIDPESEKITVMVSIFGRMTPVELNFNQIKQ